MEIGVYGLGRFGRFWAEALAGQHSVAVSSRNLRKDLPPNLQWVELPQLAEKDVVVLCVAISAMEEAIGALAPHLKPGTLVMDTCSVKLRPVEAMKSILPSNVDIIGTHPMFGPDSASSGLKGLPIVMCPVRSSDELFRVWEEAFKTMGLNIHIMSPEQHDREAAYTQGITHFIGRVLADLDLKPSEIGTMGYSKLLDVVSQTCNDSFQLFQDLQNQNPYTQKMRFDLAESLNKIMDILKEKRRSKE